MSKFLKNLPVNFFKQVVSSRPIFNKPDRLIGPFLPPTRRLGYCNTPSPPLLRPLTNYATTLARYAKKPPPPPPPPSPAKKAADKKKKVGKVIKSGPVECTITNNVIECIIDCDNLTGKKKGAGKCRSAPEVKKAKRAACGQKAHSTGDLKTTTKKKKAKKCASKTCAKKKSKASLKQAPSKASVKRSKTAVKKRSTSSCKGRASRTSLKKKKSASKCAKAPKNTCAAAKQTASCKQDEDGGEVEECPMEPIKVAKCPPKKKAAPSKEKKKPCKKAKEDDSGDEDKCNNRCDMKGVKGKWQSKKIIKFEFRCPAHCPGEKEPEIECEATCEEVEVEECAPKKKVKKSSPKAKKCLPKKKKTSKIDVKQTTDKKKKTPPIAKQPTALILTTFEDKEAAKTSSEKAGASCRPCSSKSKVKKTQSSSASSGECQSGPKLDGKLPPPCDGPKDIIGGTKTLISSISIACATKKSTTKISKDFSDVCDKKPKTTKSKTSVKKKRSQSSCKKSPSKTSCEKKKSKSSCKKSPSKTSCEKKKPCKKSPSKSSCEKKKSKTSCKKTSSKASIKSGKSRTSVKKKRSSSSCKQKKSASSKLSCEKKKSSSSCKKSASIKSCEKKKSAVKIDAKKIDVKPCRPCATEKIKSGIRKPDSCSLPPKKSTCPADQSPMMQCISTCITKMKEMEKKEASLKAKGAKSTSDTKVAKKAPLMAKAEVKKAPSATKCDQKPSKTKCERKASATRCGKKPSKTKCEKKASKTKCGKKSSKTKCEKKPSKTKCEKKPSKSKCDKCPMEPIKVAKCPPKKSECKEDDCEASTKGKCGGDDKGQGGPVADWQKCMEKEERKAKSAKHDDGDDGGCGEKDDAKEDCGKCKKFAFSPEQCKKTSKKGEKGDDDCCD